MKLVLYRILEEEVAVPGVVDDLLAWLDHCRTMDLVHTDTNPETEVVLDTMAASHRLHVVASRVEVLVGESYHHSLSDRDLRAVTRILHDTKTTCFS